VRVTTPLSCCIIAMDEEDRIADCLASVAFCDEVVLVDSHSRDRTRALAAEHGARVIERDWPGFGAQKEFAVRAARHDWVLCIDADERVSPALRAEVEALRAEGFPAHAAWRMPRLANYLGTWVRHGTWYPDLQLRLFDRRRARWGDQVLHERVELAPGATVGRLRGELLHHPYRSFAEHQRTIEQYTTLMARELFARGRRARPGDLWLRPWARFARFYLLKHGFLMGTQGLVLAQLAAHYVRLKYVKLHLLERGRALE
jgi:glycosyltransferase involved in cell wall biosynthesis